MQTVPRLYEQFQPEEYRLNLDLTKREARTFNGSVEIIGTFKGDGPLRLHAKDLEILSARSNESEVTFSTDGDHLTLDDRSMTLMGPVSVVLLSNSREKSLTLCMVFIRVTTPMKA